MGRRVSIKVSRIKILPLVPLISVNILLQPSNPQLILAVTPLLYLRLATNACSTPWNTVFSADTAWG